MTSPLLRAFTLSCAILLAACSDDSSQAPAGNNPVASAPDYWPTTAWKTATPESRGFPAGALATLADAAATALPYYTSLLVIKDGYIVHESYHDTATENGNSADTRHHVWSVTKSVTSMTLGRASTLGDLVIPAGITDKTDVLDLTVADVFPAATFNNLAADDKRRDISLRNTLQMRSGLAWNEAAWLLNTDAGRDPILTSFSNPACSSAGSALILCSILQRPLAYEPGSTWNYDTYTTYLVSGFFSRITGMSLNSYAGAHLFTPLGITFDAATDWPNLPAPYTFGGGLLNIRSRDLAKLGMLMLYKGKWEGEQLISPAWMNLSLQAQGEGKMAAFDENTKEPVDAVTGIINYGMQWWIGTEPAEAESISARGLYGQQMSIFRDKGLIVLITSDSDAEDPRNRYADINAFLKTEILDKLAP